MLHLAAFNGHVETLQYLLSTKVGAELEAKNESGETALHSAVQNGHVEALEVLVKHGASTDPDADGGSRLLHLSREGNRDDIHDTNNVVRERAATEATLRRLGCDDQTLPTTCLQKLGQENHGKWSATP